MKEEEMKVVLDPLVTRRVTDSKASTQIRILNIIKDRKMLFILRRINSNEDDVAQIYDKHKVAKRFQDPALNIYT